MDRGTRYTLVLEPGERLLPGTKIRTLEEKGTNFTEDARKFRKWGVEGVIEKAHDGHGLCYAVKHDDGTYGYYDPAEFEILKMALGTFSIFKG